MVKLRGQIIHQETPTPTRIDSFAINTLTATNPPAEILDPTSSQISMEILQMDVLSGLTAK